MDGGINTYAYVKNNPLKGIDPKGLISESPGSNFTRRSCGRAEYNDCNVSCIGRGGVSSCMVTTGTRARIVNGYPTKEIYTVSGSMSCVCNDDPPKDCPPVTAPPKVDPAKAGQDTAEAVSLGLGAGLLLLLLAL